MQLLQLLALLCCGEASLSAEVYVVFHECLRRCECASNVGFALLHQCVVSASRLYPQTQLLGAAAAAAARLLSSPSNNLRLSGVTALAALARVDAAAAAQQQLLVVDCLEDEDDALRLRTLGLLTAVTNKHNVAAVTKRLLQQLRVANDAHLRRNLQEKVVVLAER